jgi:hypothetical protein
MRDDPHHDALQLGLFDVETRGVIHDARGQDRALKTGAASVRVFLTGSDSTFVAGQVLSPNGGIYTSQ